MSEINKIMSNLAELKVEALTFFGKEYENRLTWSKITLTKMFEALSKTNFLPIKECNHFSVVNLLIELVNKDTLCDNEKRLSKTLLVLAAVELEKERKKK
jgi:hypothetical protein